MGISIEQYWSSVGSRDNFVKTKDILSRFNDHCWSLMFVMIFYNAHIPLLIRQANDVEENPDPTVFDVIDPKRTICADYSQGNEALFGENAGNQCVAISPTAVIYHHIEDINLWTSSILNNILTIGNNLYTSIRCSVLTNDYLLLTDVPCIVSIYNNVYSLAYSESLTGGLFMTSNNGPYMSLQNSLTEVFSNCQLNYNCCLLTIGINTAAYDERRYRDTEILEGNVNIDARAKMRSTSDSTSFTPTACLCAEMSFSHKRRGTIREAFPATRLRLSWEHHHPTNL
ncbi:uncharacterized protein [Pocillopora verrucosa]|uniref:uncharacterized protein n=1 Tax=Pocillopora verrucosa TaxID=203993 RepID=UPI00333EBEA0